MKRMKKVLAALLSMAMVLGMTATAFAANEQSQINVTGIGTGEGVEAATVQYVQIIKPAKVTADNPTGWAFTNDAYATAYKQAYNVTTDAAAIQALIAKSLNGVADDDQTKSAISKASAAVAAADWQTGGSNVESGSASWNVTVPGLYVIRIAQPGYNYLAMTAYVGFGSLSDVNGGLQYPDMPQTVPVVAKGAPVAVEKTNSTSENVVAVGDIVTYTISTNVPYVNQENLQSESYGISDTITGAAYVNLENATITFEDGTAMPTPAPSIVQGTGNKENTFTLDLTSLLAGNTYAGKKIIITYQARITDVDNITNTANAGHQNGDTFDTTYGTDDTKVFTGEAAITKVDTNDATKKLQGAGFNVISANGATLTFTEVKNGNTVSYYKYDPNGTVTEIVTGTDGTATVKGLALGTYSFKEITAPDGYTLNEAPATAEIKKADGVEKVTQQSQIISPTETMRDTTISSLPSTGGIGTTIFTVVGCIVMIAAAGLFFTSRRKNSAK